MNGFVLEEISSFKMLGLCSSLLDLGSYIVSVTNTTSKKIALILWGFFPLRLLFISINLPYNLIWNTFVMPGSLCLVATCLC